MSLTLTVKDHWTDGKRITVLGTLLASGNYTTNGDTLSFNNGAIKSDKVPVLVNIRGKSGTVYQYIPGTTRDTGKVKMIGGVAAISTLTSSGTDVGNNETITITGVVYTFKTTLTGAANEIKRGTSASVTLDCIKAAINGDPAGLGTQYGLGTVAHPNVVAGTKTATTLALSARVAGTAGNSFTTTSTAGSLTFTGATLGSGTDNIGGELANGAYNLGVIGDVITVEAIFPQLR